MNKIGLRLAFVWTLVLCLTAPTAVGQHTPPEAPAASRIAGKLLDARGKPVAGARLQAWHLSSARMYTSEPSRPNGECVLQGLPYGYFDLAVETTDGFYVADRMINVAPGSTAEVTLTIAAFAPSAAALERPYVGSERDPTGEAEVRLKATGREFWRSPKGVAIIAGLAGAALLAISSGADSESAATPF